MFERIIRFAIEHRWLVMLAVLGMAALGVFSYQKLPIDAVPDITNVQVQINTKAPGYSPLETEQRVTYPIETVMAGLPGLEQTRSLSRYGLSQVTVIFKEGTDIYFARQLVNERIQSARGQMPAGVEPNIGPISTGLGEIYLWTVESQPGAKKPNGEPYTATDLREIQDWVIKPQLRNVTGVTEINTIGGYAKEYHVAPDPSRLASYGITLADVVNALERNNANVGAGYIERRGEQYLIRAPGQVRSIADIGNVVLRNEGSVPVRIKDVASVELGRELRTGAATDNGKEVVLGTVFMLIGENSRTVSQAVDKKMAEINKNLPAGIHAVTVYDRTTLVDKAIGTVKKNLMEGAILVIVILFLFLGNIRAALLTAMVIPLSMLFTFTGMVNQKVSANLMSLGALDFGIIIDGAVVIVENCVRRLAHAQEHKGRSLTRSERFHEVFLASQEARRPLLFGQLIIMIVYLPIFALAGVEGKMFHPMAFTVVIALVGAMILSMTFVPAAVALFIGEKVAEKENFLMGWARRAYEPALKRVMNAKPLVITFALVTVFLSGLLATRMGSEFVPSLNEGDFSIQTLRIPGTSLSQSVAMQQQLESTLKTKFPEIERVFARTGTAEIASDPMPPNISDAYVMLKPVSEWPEPRKTRDELAALVKAEVEKMPGQNYEFSQPIQLRFNELISGVRSDVAVKVFGDDMDVMNNAAGRIAAVLKGISGATEVNIEQTTGLPMLSVQIDREKTARYGLNVQDVQDTLATAVGGKEGGTMFEGDRRFDIIVRVPENVRSDLEAIKRLPVPLPASGTSSARKFIPLSEVADLSLSPGPNQVSRENGKRRVVVSANVRGRDIGTFVAEAEQAIQQQVKLPTGYWMTWGGQFENLQSATNRLKIVVPVSLLLVFTLLFVMFGNAKDGLLVFTGIPFALTGGIVALWLRDIPMSISAAVGFIALSGVAVLNGLVMISFIRNLRESGRSLDEAIFEGAITRLRPVLMTALVASLGFVPMAIATGTGAEVQRPLATVVIGGILSSTALTLLVLPVLYRIAHRKDDEEDAPAPRAKPDQEVLA
ncbi:MULTISPECIES: CusA/CzcA family heavy metal efflux RND transporter [Roseateles]|jgi:cobalt-zinc-cadmium resistance protein CzcA|uniref:CusA/CzcA family heavy metal efflux RND transporter n=16 Tax=cellular organisms TaxID=131567 RepID=A0A254NAF3_9BURK|nr:MULTISPECIES: CusA/CzcA family heavy metal efflux RND transporter [Roseateles]MBY0367100.1 CusA/CzcA family heavy metal efflux RND transporter [Burkholderiaceae bacterium]MCY4754356.1 CusA/CzcA family heavy metal efflux RND transporter [Pelomonas aquatica]MDG0854724.1 CusA/CzcA family heavy metal efflux RND transporter [Roseateles puraquae]MDG0861595.1 CusA/CzcA family heavy metal efflux RND transporter [Pelomonas aquatica]OWR04976.1 CusA/CzcA family heavy metal efflux RND transporter [Rose